MYVLNWETVTIHRFVMKSIIMQRFMMDNFTTHRLAMNVMREKLAICGSS